MHDSRDPALGSITSYALPPRVRPVQGQEACHGNEASGCRSNGVEICKVQKREPNLMDGRAIVEDIPNHTWNPYDSEEDMFLNDIGMHQGRRLVGLPSGTQSPQELAPGPRALNLTSDQGLPLQQLTCQVSARFSHGCMSLGSPSLKQGPSYVRRFGPECLHPSKIVARSASQAALWGTSFELATNGHLGFIVTQGAPTPQVHEIFLIQIRRYSRPITNVTRLHFNGKNIETQEDQTHCIRSDETVAPAPNFSIMTGAWSLDQP